jgi:hypothetical protein
MNRTRKLTGSQIPSMASYPVPTVNGRREIAIRNRGKKKHAPGERPSTADCHIVSRSSRCGSPLGPAAPRALQPHLQASQDWIFADDNIQEALAMPLTEVRNGRGQKVVVILRCGNQTPQGIPAQLPMAKEA